MLPLLFTSRLKEIIPDPYFEGASKSFLKPKAFCLRINTIKVNPENIFVQLKEAGVEFQKVSGVQEAFFVQETSSFIDELIEQGYIYKQGLSSMMVSIILKPERNEKILDLCAAPGSKTSHMAAMMNNTGRITAVESVRSRFFRLKAVNNLLNVQNADVKLIDGRRFRGKGGLFDKVLVDAPCSSEGRFEADKPDSYAYWSLRKIKEMREKQRGLVFNGFRHLKTGGTLVYSTCTFAPEENEGVVDWLIRKCSGQLEVEKVELQTIDTYPAVMRWGKREFDPQCGRCVRFLPTDKAEGFFLSKIKKL